MKTKREVEGHACDKCDEFSNYISSVCQICGKEYCYDCSKTVGKTYSHGVYCGGSGDGFYCHECDRSTTDRKHSLYQSIESLRNERLGWEEKFDKRRKEVEQELDRMYRASK